MEVVTLFFIFALIIFIGFICEWIFEKTNIPDAIWLIILGMVINSFLGVGDHPLLSEVSTIFTTFALIFILFEGVLTIDLKNLVKGIGEGTSLSFANFLVTFISVALIMRAFGWGWLEGLLLGAMVADSAQAVIVPLLKKITIKPQTALALTFESAISDVFCIVGAVTVLNIILVNSFNLNTVIQSVLFSFLGAIFLGALCGIVWMRLHKFMDRFSKSHMTTIAALLFTYSFVEWVGANGALACLAFGIIVGSYKNIFSLFNKEDNYAITSDAKFFFSEISFFVKTFFFVYLGLIINMDSRFFLTVGVILAIILFILRSAAVYFTHRSSQIDDKDRAFLEVLNPKGLSAAVLASVPAQYGIAHASEFPPIVLGVIITSVILSIIGVFFTEKGIYKGLLKSLGLLREPVTVHPALAPQTDAPSVNEQPDETFVQSAQKKKVIRKR
jgi:NhaP-type Na+/H+ or K+/H+ antiporter